MHKNVKNDFENDKKLNKNSSFNQKFDDIEDSLILFDYIG